MTRRRAVTQSAGKAKAAPRFEMRFFQHAPNSLARWGDLGLVEDAKATYDCYAAASTIKPFFGVCEEEDGSYLIGIRGDRILTDRFLDVLHLRVVAFAGKPSPLASEKAGRRRTDQRLGAPANSGAP